MEKETKVSVFESENPVEIQIIKSKLEARDIPTYLNNKYMSFTTTPTANTISVLVPLLEEKKAFEIIDAYLAETKN